MDRLLMRHEAMAILGIRPTKFDQMVKRGELEVVRIGRRVLLSGEGLERFVRRHTESDAVIRRG